MSLFLVVARRRRNFFRFYDQTFWNSRICIQNPESGFRILEISRIYSGYFQNRFWINPESIQNDPERFWIYPEALSRIQNPTADSGFIQNDPEWSRICFRFWIDPESGYRFWIFKRSASALVTAAVSLTLRVENTARIRTVYSRATGMRAGGAVNIIRT